MARNITPDVTWSEIEAAGIDLANVHRVRNDLTGGMDDYAATSADGQTRVVFGRSVDTSGDNDDDTDLDLGWDATVYAIDLTSERFDQEVTGHFDTAAEVLAFVAKWVS